MSNSKIDNSVMTDRKLILSMLNAAEDGLLDTVKFLLAANPRLLECKDELGRTPLICAAVGGSLPVVQFLIEKGANTSAAIYSRNSDIHEFQAIHCAVHANHKTVFHYLLNNDVDSDQLVGRFKVHLIHLAAGYADLEILERILRRNNALLEQTDYRQQTPLIWAVNTGDEKVVEYLLKKGANTTASTQTSEEDPDHGKSALHYAIENGSPNVLNLLLSYGADINASVKGRHPLHLAVIWGEEVIVRLILHRYPTLLNITSATMKTPLHYAITEGQVGIFNYLMDLGADTKQAMWETIGQENKLTTPIELAAMSDTFEMLQKFAEKGANMHERYSVNQFHLIHLASINGKTDVVRGLLNDYPELLNCKDVLGQTPLIWAAAEGHTELVQLLLDEGADLKCRTNDSQERNTNGKNALDWAVAADHYEVVNHLVLKSISPEDKNTILSYIKTAVQALHMMDLQPSLIPDIVASKRLSKLIRNSPYTASSSGIIEHYEPALGRRHSFYSQLNTQSASIKLYKPVGELGSGGYGSVRLFKTRDGEPLAVKRIHETAEDTKDKKKLIGRLVEEITSEVRLQESVYPKPNSYSIFHIKQTNEQNQRIYSNRAVIPFVPGLSANAVFQTVTSAKQVAQIILEMAKELHRIHSMGIIHGDLNKHNIKITMEEGAISIRYLDFGCSYRDSNTYVAKQVEIRRGFREDIKWYPPELCNPTTPIKACTSQDVYQLGYVLDSLLRKCAHKSTVLAKYTSISSFIKQSRTEDPKSRPLLPTFINELTDDISMETAHDLFAEDNQWSCVLL